MIYFDRVEVVNVLSASAGIKHFLNANSSSCCSSNSCCCCSCCSSVCSSAEHFIRLVTSSVGLLSAQKCQFSKWTYVFLPLLLYFLPLYLQASLASWHKILHGGLY